VVRASEHAAHVHALQSSLASAVSQVAQAAQSKAAEDERRWAVELEASRQVWLKRLKRLKRLKPAESSHSCSCDTLLLQQRS
jgi:hypothetical protein